MIVFVDRYSEEIRYLQKTLQSINLECEFVVFEDSFFLPDGMLTMSEYLIRDQEQKPYRRKELHYAFLDIPNEWQIQPYGSNGVIYNRSPYKHHYKGSGIYNAEKSKHLLLLSIQRRLVKYELPLV